MGAPAGRGELARDGGVHPWPVAPLPGVQGIAGRRVASRARMGLEGVVEGSGRRAHSFSALCLLDSTQSAQAPRAHDFGGAEVAMVCLLLLCVEVFSEGRAMI